jgi:hypothetical protein
MRRQLDPRRAVKGMVVGVTMAAFGNGRPPYLIAMKVLFHLNCIPGMFVTRSYHLLADILIDLRYSKDFFDSDHQVVIGGSYATIPRIAERRSTRNWYQRKYPYPWIGARLVYDIAK